jgi:ASCH domain
MLALSIRQPYAELILQGRKRIEYRTSNVRTMLGKPFYIYAARNPMPVASEREARKAAAIIWSDDLAVTKPRRGEHPPQWMMELAGELIGGKLQTGVIVGSATIEKVTRAGDLFQWHLVDVERLSKPRKPTGHPQPVWFKPF